MARRLRIKPVIDGGTSHANFSDEVFDAQDFDGGTHGVLLMTWWVVSSEGWAS